MTDTTETTPAREPEFTRVPLRCLGPTEVQLTGYWAIGRNFHEKNPHGFARSKADAHLFAVAWRMYEELLEALGDLSNVRQGILEAATKAPEHDIETATLEDRVILNRLQQQIDRVDALLAAARGEVQ